ncbi:MAG: hypothetical protein HYT71_01400 [Candidatus Aenigmarchaeota archaeon]|nr:hypothetical protein [Candidatus Aenigmarchaeota archaeon]
MNKCKKIGDDMLNKKGITSAMLIILGSIAAGLIVLLVVIASLDEKTGLVALAIAIGKSICGFIATVIIGGFGLAICNI